MIHLDDRGPVALVIIDRQDGRNALDRDSGQTRWYAIDPR